MDIDLSVATKGLSEKAMVVETIVQQNVEDAAFSTANVGKVYKQAIEMISKMTRYAKDYTCTSRNKQQATDMGNQAKKLYKLIDARRLELKRPYMDHGKEIDKIMMPAVKALKAIESMMAKKLGAVLHAERQAELKRQRAAEAEAKKKLADAGIKNVPVSPAPVVSSRKVTAETGSSTTKMIPHFELTGSLSDVDPRFLMLNETALRAAYRNGSRGKDIKGILITEEPEAKFNNKRS